MTRAIPGPLLTALSGGTVLAGECLVLEARDGTRVGFTSLDVAQTIDLGLGAGNEVCAAGMVLSAITLESGLDASFAEVEGPLGPTLTHAAVNGGRWNDAKAWLVRISPGITGIAPVLAGKVREARVEGARFVIEIRSQGDALNQPLGRQITAYCDAEFGDARCGYAVVPVAATVTAVTDAMRFAVSFSGTYADDHFNLGKVTFTSGPLDGVSSDLVFDWTSGGAGAGSLVLWEPLSAAPAVGDALELRQGCGKTRAACLVYDNVVNFRGFPDAPGSDRVLRYPNPDE